jgi:hypothetical protein
MLLNITLYAFAAIGVFASASWILEVIRNRENDPPRGIPTPKFGWIRQPASTDAYRNLHTHVALTGNTVVLMSHLYTLEYNALPEEQREDPKARLPDGIRSGPLSARECCALLGATNYIRAKRGAEPIKLTSDLNGALRSAIVALTNDEI